MYKLFTDGVVSLMKRKITDGVAYLTQMLDNGPLDSYFEPIFYLYRAYGHFMANRHDLAIKDYQIVDRLGEKDIGV